MLGIRQVCVDTGELQANFSPPNTFLFTAMLARKLVKANGLGEFK